jgi:hypothetical protein
LREFIAYKEYILQREMLKLAGLVDEKRKRESGK